MRESTQWRLSAVLGWLLIAVPSALLLALTAWLGVYRWGVDGSVATTSALVLWVAWLVWRSKHLRG